MPFYLNGSGAANQSVSLASPIVVGINENYEIEFEADCVDGAQFGVRFAWTTGLRILLPKGLNPSITTPNATLATAGGINTVKRSIYIIRRVSNLVTLTIDGVQQAATASISTGFSLDTLLNDKSNMAGNPCRFYYLKFTKSGVLTNHYDPSASNGTGNVLIDVVGGNNGTLNNFPTDGTQWVEYGAAVTPIAFNGTIPAQSATVGTPFSLNVSSFFTGNQTPFTYAIQSGTLPAGLTLSGSTISGTPTTEGSATITVRGTDAASNTATSNSFTITVAAAASVPQGTVTIGTVTAAQTTASVPFTYSLSDQTGFQYRLNGGAAVAAPSSPINLTGLTASTAYTIEVRATNGAGAGNWSAVTNFTTQAAVVQGTFTSEPFRRLVDGALMGNKSFTYFRLYNNSTGALVLNRTGLTSNASGIVTITDAAIVSGTTYKVDWQTADGEFCMPSKAAT